MDPRSGVKNYVRLPVSLKRHPDRSGGILPADRENGGEGKEKKKVPRCRLSEGAYVHMAAVQ